MISAGFCTAGIILKELALYPELCGHKGEHVGRRRF
jgi:hypothetical protein